MEFSNPQNQEKQFGVKITVTEGGRLERESSSFIDADEVDGLLASLDYFAKVTKTVTKFENFEAVFRTKGDFKILVFNNSEGGLSASVDSGRFGSTSVYMDLKKLAAMRQIIVQAKSTIDANKRP